MPIDGAGLPARVIRPRLAGGGARRAGVRNGRTRNGRTRNGAPRLIGGDMDKSADERGNTGPTDDIKTKGDAGTLDAKLIITRRILWWIGLVLLLPFTLNLVHFDGPYLMLERILCAIPPKLASDPSSIVGLPLLEAEWFREFLTLALGIACWSVVGITKLAATNPSSHGRKILAVRIFAGIITITVLIATGITGFFLALALLM